MARILVVYPELHKTVLFKNVLTRHGYEVSAATNYADAVKIVETIPIQLVFFRVWLSAISGVDLAHTLRTLDPTLPLVALISDFSVYRSRLEPLNVKEMTILIQPDTILQVTRLYIRSDNDASIRPVSIL